MTEDQAEDRAEDRVEDRGAIAILGGGSMAGAVAQAMLRSTEFDGASPPELRVTTRTSTPQWATGAPRVSVMTTERDPLANQRAVDGAGVIMLGVLPDDVEPLVCEIAPHLTAGAVVVSVAVTPGLDTLERLLPDSAGVVRTMPNLPVDIGEGVIGVARGSRVTEAQFARVTDLLTPAGLIVPVEEAQLDLFTAIPGGGPAYIAYFIDAMVTAAERLGLPEADAIVRAIFRGAVARLDAYAGDAANGTTAGVRAGMLQEGNVTWTGVQQLEAHGVADAISAAYAAGVDRAREFTAQ